MHTRPRLASRISSLLFLWPVIVIAEDHKIELSQRLFKVNNAVIDTYKVSQGQSIVFANRDRISHALAHNSELMNVDTGKFMLNESVTIEFDQAGSFELICTLHPQMKLLVDVD